MLLQKFPKHFAPEAPRRSYAGVMPRLVPIARPQRTNHVAREFHRPALTRRAVAWSQRPVPYRDGSAAVPPSSAWAEPEPDPYVDYGRWLTPEGGILIIHKDFDLRLRHTLWRLFAWTLATGGEAWHLLHHPLLRTGWILVSCIITVAIINWRIVRKPVEVYRKVEIRPDCLIIEGTDVFWRRFMEDAGFPRFMPGNNGEQIFCGIYGTRFVEYLIIRKFDEFDRGAEVCKAHIRDAMLQLWNRPV